MDETPGHAEFVKKEAHHAAQQRLLRLEAMEWPAIAAECQMAHADFKGAGFTGEQAFQLLLAFLQRGQ